MSTYPIEFKDLEEENEALHDEVERLEALLKSVVEWFDKISRYQHQRLEHGLKEACQNWGETSEVEFFDIEPLRQALQKGGTGE